MHSVLYFSVFFIFFSCLSVLLRNKSSYIHRSMINRCFFLWWHDHQTEKYSTTIVSMWKMEMMKLLFDVYWGIEKFCFNYIHLFIIDKWESELCFRTISYFQYVSMCFLILFFFSLEHQETLVRYVGEPYWTLSNVSEWWWWSLRSQRERRKVRISQFS